MSEGGEISVNPVERMRLSIWARMRFTSDRPSAWISAGVRVVVVWTFTLYAYQAAPLGSAFMPIVSRERGMYVLVR